MKKILKKNEVLTLNGNQVKKDDLAIDFTVLDIDFNEIKLSDYIGKKVIISTFPSIDTRVCSLQTKKFNMEASKLKNTIIINVSLDLPYALTRFCHDEKIENMIIASDYKNREFGKKYGLLIEELKLLARSVTVIDENGIVRYVEIAEELSEELNYSKVIEMTNNI